MIEERIQLKRDNITLNGMLFIPKRGEKHPALIVAHGLPSTPLPVEEKGYDVLGRNICELGLVSIIFNFSGCQGSEGFFSIKNWVKDLDLVSNYIWNLEEVDPSRVAFLAFSMGTYPTIYYIAHLDKNAENYPILLIICACPADLSDKRLSELRVGIHLTNQMGGIRIQGEYDKEIVPDFSEHMPIRWIEHIAVPKFIFHGKRDDLVNVKNAYKLFERATEPKKLIILDEAGHKLRQDANAMEKIFDIIENSLL